VFLFLFFPLVSLHISPFYHFGYSTNVLQAVLQLADDFIDTVISSACKLSKLRDSPQLDIRDIQVILERNYNIRIPGYASDEVRTVRKIVPSQGWVSKMAAVSAAKVMGGRGGD
jgi:transcription initiation factor TFIID subunit TAF12